LRARQRMDYLQFVCTEIWLPCSSDDDYLCILYLVLSNIIHKYMSTIISSNSKKRVPSRLFKMYNNIKRKMERIT
jgi:hypothetical protein